MYRLVLIPLICALLVPGVVSAQDGDELQCSETDIGAVIDGAIGMLTDARSREPTQAYQLALQARNTLFTLDGMCLGLNFEGNTDTVYDPVFVPSGVYRVTLTAAAGSIMRLEALVLDGKCQEFYEAGEDFRLFGVGSDQDASKGVQALLQSDGCTVIWNTWWVDSPYTVTFEKIR